MTSQLFGSLPHFILRWIEFHDVSPAIRRFQPILLSEFTTFWTSITFYSPLDWVSWCVLAIRRFRPILLSAFTTFWTFATLYSPLDWVSRCIIAIRRFRPILLSDYTNSSVKKNNKLWQPKNASTKFQPTEMFHLALRRAFVWPSTMSWYYFILRWVSFMMYILQCIDFSRFY